MPNQIDPRGFLSFGMTGIGVLLLSWLMMRGQQLPRGLALLGLVSGIFLIALYLERLIILDASHPVVLFTAAVSGFILCPAWYGRVGRVLRKS